jgi:hypothetical protein
MTPALNDVLRLCQYHTPSFPCRADKKPACTHGFKDATADPDKLKSLWLAFPGSLVGVPTGEASGIFVIDIDSARHNEANDWLERWSPYLPETRQHATQSSGWHLLFKHQAGLKNTAGKLAKGVDTRGDGGYIIWWPFHLGVLAPHKLDNPLCDLPDEIFEQIIERPRSKLSPPISPHRSQPHKSIEPLLAQIRNAQEGERNSRLFWSANRICELAWSGALDASGTSNALHALARAAFNRGLSAKEIESTINSATRGQR